MKKSISVKIFSIALLFMALMAAVSGFSTFSLGQVSKKSRDLSNYYLPLERHVQMAARHASSEVIYFDNLVSHQRGGSAGEDIQTAQREMERQSALVDDEIGQALQLVGQGRDDKAASAAQLTFMSLAQELPQIIDAHHEMRDSIKSFIAELETRQADAHAIVLLNGLLQKQRAKVAREILDVTDILDKLTKDSADVVLQQERKVLFLDWGITLVVSFIGLALAWIITRSLVRPLHDLLTGTRAAQNGDLTVEVKVTSSDELATLTDAFNRMIRGLKQKEEIQNTFGHYVDPRIVKSLIEEGGAMEREERKRMSVFFSDLEGFTSLCEQIQPDLAVKFLNRYFDTMAGPIQASNGIIDKYIGDSIMAYWGPPFCGEQEHARLACETAIEQMRLMESFREEVPGILGMRRNVPFVNMRIGISTGDVTLGNVGSSRQKGYTVIGDSVNLAARLESANKQYGTNIIIPEHTWEHVHDHIDTRELDSICVIGKTEPVRIFEVIGRKGEAAPALIESRDLFVEALASYRNGEFGKAGRLWRECLRINPDDHAAQLFTERIALLQREGIPQNWDGVWNLRSK